MSVQIRPQGLSLTRVRTTVARCRPLSLRRRRIWSTSPARPRRRMSAAPTPSSRSRAANRFSFHGADSTTRSVRAKGVATSRSAVRKAIRGSIFRAPSSRARSSTSPALVTAGLGSSRYSPGSPTSTGSAWPPGSPGARVSVSPAGRIVARREAVANAGDHSTASLRSRPSAMNSASQPGGISSAGRPGAALTQTAGTRPARARHQSSGGCDTPAGNRRVPARRAGSMNAASAPSSAMSRTSATQARTRSASP